MKPDPKDDSRKSEKITRIDDLKQKLYSNAKAESAVRVNNLRPHHVDIGKNWEETDEKTSILEERERQARERERLGLATQNALHHNSTQYGHFSAAENLAEYSPENRQTKTPIKTALPGNRESAESPDSIGAFLSDKFADIRAGKTEKKMAVQDLTMKYAAANIQKSIYPDIKNKTDEEEKQKQAKADNQTGVYHPDIQVVSIGKNSLKKQSITKEDQQKIDSQKDNKEYSTEEKSRSRFGAILFSIITLFLIGSVVYAYYTLDKGKNVISADKIDLQIIGPVSVRSGEVSDFNIDITNNNSGNVILSDIVIQYPEGTRSAVDTGIGLVNDRIDVGTVLPGQTIRRKARAVFFGEENVKKKIQYTYEFNIEDSATVFTADKEVGVFIASSPVEAKIVNVTEITNNQDLSFDIEITSNSEEVVKDIQLKVEYPFGYSLTESNLKPVADNNTWNIGDIEPLGKKTISLKGKMIGTSNIEKNFRFTLGVLDRATKQISAVLSTQDQKVLIKKPFVVTLLSLDGISQPFRVAGFEEKIKGDLSFVNNLTTPITDVVVEMSIAGIIIDRESIKTTNGFYRSSDDVIFWDKTQEEKLALVKPGEVREVSFNMNVLKSSPELIKALRRTSANLVVSIKAKRLNENNVPEEIVSGTSEEIRLESSLALNSGLSFASGPFKNTGAFPPVVNKETTYTYVGKIYNTTNSVKNAVFTAKLPPNTVWKNVYSSDLSSGSVSYSDSRREITINLGDIPSGTGEDEDPRQFAFQLGFTPTLTEKGKVPNILLQPRIVGLDTFTNRNLVSGDDYVDIIPRLDSENTGQGIVE